MDADPALSSIIMVQSVKGAGERNSPRTCQHDEAKDGENSVCFERMGMGDLETADVADIADAGVLPVVVPEGRVMPGGIHVPPTEAWPSRPLDQPSMSCCFMEWTPADSSDDDDDDVGLLDAVDHTALHEAMGMPRAATPAAAQAAQARSKLSITNTSLISLPAPALQEEVAELTVHEEGLGDKAPELACGQYDDADLEGLLEESEDELSLKAPTPDNTPVNSPPGEAYSGLVSHPDSALLSSTLNNMVSSGVARAQSYSGSSTPSPDATPMASPGTSPTGTLSRSVSTLGRVWSRILGRGRSGSKKAAAASPVASPPQRLIDSEDDEADVENLPGLEVDSHTIDELEATLEEVRLDGDGDDPVVSYLVEEAEDVARPQAAASGDVTVEEVHDDEDGDDSREDADSTGPTLVEPTTRPSGLLSRLFSRSRTSQDTTSSDPAGELLGETPGTGAPTESTESPGRFARAKERGPSMKRGRAEASSRDRLHRLKPRQPNKAAVRGSLPRILSRWLRQAEARAEAGAWGAEGDAGETVVEGVSPRLELGAARGRQPSHPPALERTRRAQPSIESRDSRPRKNLEDGLLHAKHQITKSLQDEKLVADFGSQAGESMLPKSTSFQSQESRGASASFMSVADASDYI